MAVPEYRAMGHRLLDVFVGIIFAGSLVGMGFMQTRLKDGPQLLLLAFGLLTVVSFYAKPPFRSSVPFYILLGAMLYTSIFLLVHLITNSIAPDTAWIIDAHGERRRVMGMNWIWGVLAGLILSPLMLILYHRKVRRNRILEISLTVVFILSTGIIYFK